MNKTKIKVHFILEGYEEETLFQLIEMQINNESIEMTYRNCKGGGIMPAYYQAALQSDNYDIIYCVYDVDFKSNDENSMYNMIRKGLFKVLGDQEEIDKISLCTNPNALLLLLLGYDDIDAFKNIQSDKKSNTKLISKYCPKIGNKKEYDASDWQLELIKNDYIYNNKASFSKMLESIDKIKQNYKFEIGSNAIPIIKALLFDDKEFFIKELNKFN